MSTIYLIRHGNKQRDVSDPGLTAIGQEQAKKTGLFLKQFPISKIISSPLARAQQTAQLIADALALSVKTDLRLHERMEWRPEEISKDDFLTEWLKASRDRNYAPSLGDSSTKTGEKVASIIQEIGSAPTDHIVLVTHGGALIDFLRNNFDEKIVLQLFSDLPEGADYSVGECSITTVKFENGDYTLVDLNQISHLK